MNRFLKRLCALVLAAASAAMAHAESAPKRRPLAGSLRGSGAYGIILYYMAPPKTAVGALAAHHVKSTHFKLQTEEIEPGRPPATAPLATYRHLAIDKARPPSPAVLQHFGRGLSKTEQEQLQTKAIAAELLFFEYPATVAIRSVKEADLLVFEIARTTGGYIFDTETREVFSTDAWRDRRVTGWQDATTPQPRDHLAIHAYQAGSGYRAVTLGLGKFGVPDVAINDFAGVELQRVDHLMEEVVRALVLSPTLSPKGELSIGSSSPTMIPLAWSEPQDGDVPNGNHLVEVKSLTGVLDRFEPAKNHVFAVANDDKAIAAAIAKAKARVPALKAQFTRGLKATESLDVKAEFRDGPNQVEVMWVHVQRWEGNTIRGTLGSAPRFVTRLVGGQIVEISQEDIVDYRLRSPNGSDGPLLDDLLKQRALKQVR